jgi:hypothetical protein
MSIPLAASCRCETRQARLWIGAYTAVVAVLGLTGLGLLSAGDRNHGSLCINFFAGGVATSPALATALVLQPPAE